MSVYKRGKYWVVQFNHNKKTYTRSSKSTRKRDALELERQMRQQLVDTQVLGHREHINCMKRVMRYSAPVRSPVHTTPYGRLPIASKIISTISFLMKSLIGICPDGSSMNANGASKISPSACGPGSSIRSAGTPIVLAITRLTTNGASGISRISQSVI